MALTGILLAAGKGARFDSSGVQNKLLQPLADGNGVAVTAARNLLAALPNVLAVVRPGSDALAAQLRQAGCTVCVCDSADEGMAASLVHAVSHARQASGWLIALADMPFVQPHTMHLLVEAIVNGAQIAAPTWSGQRGNPVAFGRLHLPRLLDLRGDQGARRLLQSWPVLEIATDDPGILQDIDTAADLQAVRRR